MEDSDHQDYIAPLERDIERLEKELKSLKDNMFAMQQEFRRAYVCLDNKHKDTHHKDSDEDKCRAFLERFD